MSDYAAHIWTMVCALLIMVMAIFVWFFNFENLNDTMASDNLQDATRMAMYMSSDNSARDERGSFVISKPKFSYYMNHIKIKQLGNKTLGSSGFNVSYLPDDEAHDSDVIEASHGHFSGNDHDVGYGRNERIANSSAPYHQFTDGSTYEPIRALRVVADIPSSEIVQPRYRQGGKVQQGTSRNGYSKFTATDVVQTNAKDSSNDTQNDLTR